MPANLKPVLAGVIAAVEEEGKQLQAEFFRRKGPRGKNAKAPIDKETGLTPGVLEGWVWLVDPQDGTREFLAGRRGSSISVALVRGTVAVLGVVHAPLPPHPP